MTTPTTEPGSGTPVISGVLAFVERLLLTEEVRLSTPGPQIFDPATGQYVPGPDVVAYEGPGLHRAAGGPGVVLRLEGQPYKDDGDGRYLLFTPMAAPVAAEGNTVTIVKSGDPAAAGRIFKILDPGETGALSVVRQTWMRIEKIGGAA
ncbi:hypothetical protein F4556_005046 [Kitasatospora gansuensis]|uniref:Uncharacterized protein n=1 Tax=Kitasatospora gansuensis TaxID=258050 RepID=A0A7W7SHP7_9ACTN|nr:DUF6093 family protein [Kitasatospora gansuensis]MBB4949511.1 hypothetical protein [Kitasatospora gansuensis]